MSQEGAADLNGIVTELQSAVKELHRYVLQPSPGDQQQRMEELANREMDGDTARGLGHKKQ
jgi:hypothetical protein